MSSYPQNQKQEPEQEPKDDPMSSLREELRLLEAETFEIEDFVDLGQSMPGGQVNSCYSCSITS